MNIPIIIRIIIITASPARRLCVTVTCDVWRATCDVPAGHSSPYVALRGFATGEPPEQKKPARQSPPSAFMLMLGQNLPAPHAVHWATAVSRQLLLQRDTPDANHDVRRTATLHTCTRIHARNRRTNPLLRTPLPNRGIPRICSTFSALLTETEVSMMHVAYLG